MSELFYRAAISQGCRMHGKDSPWCEPPLQAAHIIAKQTLKRHGHADKLWDPRNGLGACYRAHRRSDAGLERFDPALFKPGFWEFADEVDLRWWVERIYGKVAA